MGMVRKAVGLFRGQRNKPNIDDASLQPRAFGVGYFPTWEERPLPGPGSQNFSWEFLALQQYTPIGHGVVPFRQLYQMATPSMVGQSVTTDGLPTVAGQIITQPLIDPRLLGGY